MFSPGLGLLSLLRPPAAWLWRDQAGDPGCTVPPCAVTTPTATPLIPSFRDRCAARPCLPLKGAWHTRGRVPLSRSRAASLLWAASYRTRGGGQRQVGSNVTSSGAGVTHGGPCGLRTMGTGHSRDADTQSFTNPAKATNTGHVHLLSQSLTPTSMPCMPASAGCGALRSQARLATRGDTGPGGSHTSRSGTVCGACVCLCYDT